MVYDLALQAVHLGRPGEALSLVRIGHALASGGPHPATATTRGCLASIQARAHAAAGNTRDCDRALGETAELFHTDDGHRCCPWGRIDNVTRLAAHQGAAQYALARSGRDPRAAGQAVDSLTQAVGRFGADHAKVRALYLPDLTGAYALAGDPDTAVRLGHQAVDAVAAVSSPRAADKLRSLGITLEPFQSEHAGVTDLRQRIAATAA